MARSAANLSDPYRVSEQFSQVLTLIITEMTNLLAQLIRCTKKSKLAMLEQVSCFILSLDTINSAPFSQIILV